MFTVLTKVSFYHVHRGNELWLFWKSFIQEEMKIRHNFIKTYFPRYIHMKYMNVLSHVHGHKVSIEHIAYICISRHKIQCPVDVTWLCEDIFLCLSARCSGLRPPPPPPFYESWIRPSFLFFFTVHLKKNLRLEIHTCTRAINYEHFMLDLFLYIILLLVVIVWCLVTNKDNSYPLQTQKHGIILFYCSLR